MIALQTLKYKIFEWCIDTMLEKLVNNFQYKSNDLTKIHPNALKVGMILREISLLRIWELPPHGKIIFGNCVIVSLVRINTDTHIEFEFETLNGRTPNPEEYAPNIQSWSMGEDGKEMEFFL